MAHMEIFYRVDLQISDPKIKLFASTVGVVIFEVASKTELASKYILDNFEVFAAHFSYINHKF